VTDAGAANGFVDEDRFTAADADHAGFRQFSPPWSQVRTSMMTVAGRLNRKVSGPFGRTRNRWSCQRRSHVMSESCSAWPPMSYPSATWVCPRYRCTSALRAAQPKLPPNNWLALHR
jgi:hypothetical protein